jgi:hypothetical protein
MRLNLKNYSLGQKVIIFILGCIVVSTIFKTGSKYYFDNYWYPGLEKNILKQCANSLQNSSNSNTFQSEIQSAQCNCYLEKIKSRFRPKDLSSVSKKEYEQIFLECMLSTNDSL